jgi:hypothetical protein
VRRPAGGITHPGTFKTQALTDSRIAELPACPRNGVAFDVTTGPPAPEVRQARAGAAKAGEPSWHRRLDGQAWADSAGTDGCDAVGPDRRLRWQALQMTPGRSHPD